MNILEYTIMNCSLAVSNFECSSMKTNRLIQLVLETLKSEVTFRKLDSKRCTVQLGEYNNFISFSVSFFCYYIINLTFLRT